MQQEQIRVMIVEDQEPVREGLKILIGGSEGYICVAACQSAEEALEKLEEASPDVVLMDIHLPGMRGTECVSHIKSRFPDIQVMMLTVFENTDEIFASLEAGATGYLLKKNPPARLLEAIRELVDGGSPMSSEIARKVVTTFAKPVIKSSHEESLTPREEEILAYLSKGYLYKEIASMLCISIDTVRSHIRKIYQKLHVRSRTEATIRFMKK